MKITREHSVLTGRNTMKSVYCLPNMPVHFGCVDFSSDKDIHMNQEFMICEETGILQIKHFPTADLLYMTRHDDAIGDVLDNSPLKIGKRMYGTNLHVKDPIEIKNRDCAVILKVAAYREEIMTQLIKINPNVVILE